MFSTGNNGSASLGPKNIKCDIFRDYVSFSVLYESPNMEDVRRKDFSSDQTFKIFWSKDRQSKELFAFKVKLPLNATNIKAFKGDKPEVLMQYTLDEKPLIRDAQIMLLSEHGIYNVTKQVGSTPLARVGSTNDGGRTSENQGRGGDSSRKSDDVGAGLVGDITYMKAGQIILKKDKMIQHVEYPRYIVKGTKANSRALRFWMSDKDVRRGFVIRLEFGLVYNPNLSMALENYVSYWPNEANYNKSFFLDEIMKNETMRRYKSVMTSYWYPWHFLNLDAGESLVLSQMSNGGSGGGKIDSTLLKSNGIHSSKLSTYVTLNASKNIPGEAIVLPNTITNMTLRKENFLDRDVRDFIDDFYKKLSNQSEGGGSGSFGMSASQGYGMRNKSPMSVRSYVQEETTTAVPPSVDYVSSPKRSNASKKKKLYGLTLSPNPKYILASNFKVDYVLESIDVPTLMVNKVHLDNNRMEVGDCLHVTPRKTIFLKHLDDIRKGTCRIRDEYKEEVVSGDQNRLEISNETKYINVNKLHNLKFKICLTNVTKTAAPNDGSSQTEMKNYTVETVRVASQAGANFERDSEVDESLGDYSSQYDLENPYIVYLFVFTEAHSVEIKLNTKEGPRSVNQWNYSSMESYTKKLRNKTTERFSAKYPLWVPFQHNLEEYLSVKYGRHYPSEVVLAPVIVKKSQFVDLEVSVEKYIYNNNT